MSIDTVNDLEPRVQYVAAAAQTDFDYPFPIFADADLLVYVDGVLKTLTTHYTVAGEGNDAGGTVTFVTPMTGAEVVTILREIAVERLTDLQQNGPWRSASINDEQDKTYLILQELKAADKRALRLPRTTEVDTDDLELPLTNWANKYLTFDAFGAPAPAALSSETMTAATIGALLYPRTAAEIAAGVTPTNYAYEEGQPERYGAVADGSTDDSAAIRAACSVAANYGVVRFTKGKRYRFEHSQVNPYAGTGTQCGYVFNGKTGIRIFAEGATFVSSTVGNAVLGLFTFYDCTDCVVYAGTAEGSYTPDSAWTGAYVAFMGLSKNCRLEQGSIRGGYALAVILDRTSAVSGSAANEPIDCYVSGHADDVRRLCMYLGAGGGHVCDVRGGDVSRFYVEGIRGLTGSVTIRNTDTAYSNEKILITCSNAGVTENIDLLLNCDLAGANFVRFQNQDTTGISFKNIKLRGRVSGVPTSTGVSLGASSGGTGVTYSDIDLSDLKVIVTSGTAMAVYVIPSHAITMRNITLPRIVTSASTGNVVQIDNTATATISAVAIPDNFYWRSTDAGANLLFYSASGTVGSMSIGNGGVFDYAGSGATPVQVLNASGLIVGKFRMAQNKTFYTVGSVNVSPYVIDQLSRGFIPAGAVTDVTDYSGIDSMLVTSGTATINSLSRIVPGQRITFHFNGGTPTFANGTNMKLAGGTNFVATQYDTLTLVCIDPPSGGPLETSTMVQAGADVNA